MRKQIVLVIAVLGLSLTAQAQELTYGLKGGLNIAGLSNMGDDSKMKPTFYAGIFAEYQLSDYVGIQPELIYSRQGDKIKMGSAVKYWDRLNYLNIPVLAKIYLLENLSLEVGPQFGFLLNSRYKVKDSGTTITGKIENIKTFDFAVAMGLTYRFGYSYEASFRYNLGLTDIVKDNEGDKVRNGVIQVGVGYRF